MNCINSLPLAITVMLFSFFSHAEMGKKSVNIGKSITGNYLAGNHAQYRKDFSTALDFLLAALNVDPTSPALLHRTFSLMILEGRIEEAKGLARRLVDLETNTTLAYLTLAVNEIKQGNYQLANTQLKKIQKNSLIGIVAPLIRAWILIGQEKVIEAKKILRNLPKEKSIRTFYYLHSALINEFLGKFKEAKNDYKKIQSNRSEMSLRTVLLLGALYEKTGEKNKAKKLYEKYLLEHPETKLFNIPLDRIASGRSSNLKSITITDGLAELLFGVSSFLRLQNDKKTPLMLGQFALFLKPQFPILQILLGDILETSNQPEKALKIYQMIPKQSSFSWHARLRVANILGRINRLDEAIKYLLDMSQDKREEPGPLINLGDLLRGQERFIEAIDAYNKAFERIKNIEPKHWSLLYARGIALERSKQWPKAEKDFLSALVLKPEQPYVLNYLGYSWIDQGLHLDRAQAMISLAANLRPNDGYIIDSLGWGYYKLGQFEKAVKNLERAVELRPQDPILNDHLGDALWHVGRKREAVFQWKRSLSLEPEKDLVIKLNKKILSGLNENTKTIEKESQ